MVKLYIVEDEMLLREMIKRIVDYDALGIEIVGEADNSATALEDVRALTPDIVFMDINIPYINGLELSKMLKSLVPSLRIVIITGYSDFEYARTAISIGVSEYICKPIHGEELEAVLSKLRDEILKERQSREVLEGLVERENAARSLQRGQYLTDLTTGLVRDSQETISTRFSLYDIPFNARQFVCAVISVRTHAFGRDDDPAMAEVEVWLSSRLEARQFVVYPIYPRLVLLLDAEIMDSLALDGLIQFLERYLSTPCRLGIGSKENQYSAIPSSYGRAVDTLDEYFHGDGAHIVYWEDAKTSRFIPSVRVDLLSQLTQALAAQLMPQVYSLLDSMMGPMYHTYILKKQLINLLGALINVAVEYLNACGFSLEGLGDMYGSAESMLSECTDIAAIKARLTTLYERALEVVQSSRSEMNAVIIKARIFIQAHYSDPIVLNDIAKACGVSPAYLSKQFKQKTGTNLVSYIEELRLSRAKAMMDEDPEATVSELCKAVGYEDAYYFSKRFKARFGISPRGYIEKALQQRMNSVQVSDSNNPADHR